jgi:hypothetical protein
VDDLGAAMVDIALNGSEIDTVGNVALRKRGRKLLAKRGPFDLP